MSSLQLVPIILAKEAYNDVSLRRLVIGGFFLLSFLKYSGKAFKNEVKKIKRFRYPNHVVILHRLRKGYNTPQMNPSLSELETWLKMAHIPYRAEFDSDVFQKGTFITYNQKDVIGTKDSIKYLSNLLKINFDEHLNESDMAIARGFQVLIRESLKWAIGLEMYVFEPNKKVNGLTDKEMRVLSDVVKELSYSHGYGRHSTDEIYVIGVTDLKAINDFIGEKRYFMGDKLSNIDATLFGYLTQLINHSDGKLSNYVKTECPNIIRHHDTIKTQFYTDWNELIRNSKELETLVSTTQVK